MATIAITVKDRQTIWDIAIQQYGGIEGVQELIDDNPELTRSSILHEGQILKIKSDPVNRDVQVYYKEKRLKPVSSALSDGKLGGDYNSDFNNDFN